MAAQRAAAAAGATSAAGVPAARACPGVGRQMPLARPGATSSRALVTAIAPGDMAAYTARYAAFVPSPPVIAPACLSGGGADAGGSVDQPLEPDAVDRADVHECPGSVGSELAACRSSIRTARHRCAGAPRRRVGDAASRQPRRSDTWRGLRLLRVGRTRAAIAHRGIAVPAAAAANTGSGAHPGKCTLGLSVGCARRTWPRCPRKVAPARASCSCA